MIFGFLALLLVAGCSHSKPSKLLQQNLDSNWTFKKASDTAWLPATVPGTVHTDLLHNGLIGDPYFRDNEKRLQWIEKESWQYRSRFDASEGMPDKQHIILTFDGLDTYARVKLNGQDILHTDNMFRTWTADVKPFLKRSNNLLEITFLPAAVQDSIKAAADPHTLPDSRAYSRKAPYQYGWDWGPRFVTCGVWRPVTLTAWDGPKIDNLHILQDSVDPEKAYITFSVKLLGNNENQDQDNKLSLKIYYHQKKITEKSMILKTGIHNTNIPVVIEDPQLWWCIGMGDPALYTYTLELKKNGQTFESRRGHFGIRTIGLVQEPDSTGQSFYFTLNGKPVFAKGANYIPQDNFLPRVDSQRYRALIGNAAAAGMNMLRVWGGGVYENDLFYDLCDENGIMVWQDFMFACTMYPGDSAFLDNVAHEAADNIIRLRNHPSLALWCGNNEVDEGWHNWGWQQALGYSGKDSAEIWHNYLKLFQELLPEKILALDPGRPYHPSSPTIGWGHHESMLTGDSHYWGVWWGEEPFSVYLTKTGRFMSEYGFQGMPPLESIRQFTLPEDRHSGSAVMEAHQKHPRGSELIHTYMQRDFPVPDDFADFDYVSQLLQAEGMRTAIEAHRRAMPSCMGSLYWQLNDCWPVTSWSSVDYYGRWKALHYFAGKAFAPDLLSVVQNKGHIDVFMITDRYDTLSGTLNLTLIDFYGKQLWHQSRRVSVSGPESKVVYSGFENKIVPHGNENKSVLVAEFVPEKGDPVGSLYYFVRPKALDLPEAEPELMTTKETGGYRIEINSPVLIKNLALSHQTIDGRFDRNFLDVLPGESTTVHFTTDDETGNFTNGLQVRSLNRLAGK